MTRLVRGGLFLQTSREATKKSQLNKSFSSLLQSSEIPGRLANNTWNCSVQHWPRFQRHFCCNLRQECVSGEDEVQCPFSPCSHGGVSFAGHCYFTITSNVTATHLEARQECRKVGAHLASLTSPREWSDVTSWLFLAAPLFNDENEWSLYVGVASAPPTLPFM